ncbi:MAG: heavy metal translocating P-type ATPase, partial [Aureliella sp.]
MSSGSHTNLHRRSHAHVHAPKGASAIDPVCGMTVNPATAAGSFEYAGQTYYFCSEGCLDKFAGNPEKYVHPGPTHTAGTHAQAHADDHMQPSPPASGSAPAAASASAIDPVCGMTVDPATAAGSLEHDGQTYYFCSQSCRQKFASNPAQYLAPPGEPPEAPVAKAGEKVEYTCPMHPEVVSDHPGACPKCGMALEPRTVQATEAPNEELIDMTRRFWIGLALGLPVFVIAMADMIPNNPLRAWAGALNWVQLVLATPVVFWCGWPFFQRAWLSIRNASPNMFTLIALGVGASYLYSAVATIAPGIFPHSFRHAGGAVMPYFDTAVVVTVLILLGQVLEQKARSRTSGAIRRLLNLAPSTARRVMPDGTEVDVELSEVKPGDLLRLRPGEKVAGDGVVVEGTTSIDESMISGEPIPVEKKPGDRVIAATINGTGSLLMRAEKVGSDTLLAQIIRMVSEAQRSRAPIERIVDQVARYFVPAVIAVSIVTFIVWSVWGTEPKLTHALVNAVAVLIIACPCALGLATPMAIMVGVGRGAEHGVLVKNVEALEVLQRADVLVVDKTGTLTEGKPQLASLEPLGGYEADEALRLAASLERGSEHPLAAAILKAAQEKQLRLATAENFQSISGKGITGIVEGKQVALGNPPLMQDQGIATESALARMQQLRESGQTVMCLAASGQLVALIGVADRIKETAAGAVDQLRGEGLRVIMLTGDSRTTASAVAKTLHIDEVIAEVLPDQKLDAIKRLQAEGHVVAMAGDGINDAPALAQAHIGIAMGSGTDVAMESAGVTLVQGDLRSLVRARRLSRATITNIRQNLFLAFIYNLVSIPVAAGALYPPFGILISPIWASVAMSLSSLSVVGNALRLRSAQL